MGMESRRQEKYPQPSKKAKKNRLLWVCENIRQEKYPQPSKKAIKNRLLWVWRAEDRKNTHSQAPKL